MRIAFVAPFGLGRKTTIWARTLPLARYLAQRGHAVALFIPPWDTPGDAGTHYTDAGVAVQQVAIRGGLPFIFARLWRRLAAFAPDIVHVVKPIAYAGMVQWALWQRRRLPGGCDPRLVLDIDDWEQAWLPINDYARPVRRFLTWQEEWGIRHADAITAASRWLIARAQHYAPQTPLLYLPNGVSVDQVAHAAAAHEAAARPAVPTVLFFSRFIEVEPAWLAEFWAALHPLHPDVCLRIAGDALQPGRTAHFAAALRQRGAPVAQRAVGEPPQPGVDFLGFVKPDALPALYAGTDCAIFPAADVPLHRAKCSVRLATTLLHGVPVVASSVGQQAEYGAAGAAVLVPSDATPAQFAREVATVLATPQHRHALSQRAAERLRQQYSWPRLGARLEQFYQQMIVDR
jgi:glycosyltransferase involved in cell wall biosynthesis